MALARRWPLIAVLVVAALTFAASVSFPFVHWDDPRYACENPLVIHPLAQGWTALLTTVPLGYPQVVTVLSYAGNYALFGLAPWSFHLANVLLHLLNVALVVRIARELGLSTIDAALAGMIFALHPLVVEPVCWVTGRKDLLATAFLLGGAVVMLGGPGGREAPFPRPRRWAVVTLLCAVGMGAKPSVAVAAGVLGAIAFGARPGWSVRRIAAALVPVALVGVGALVAAAKAQSGVDTHPRTLSNAVLDVVGACTLQLGHLVAPLNLVTQYERDPGDPSVAAMIVATLLLLALVASCVRLVVRGQQRSPIVVGVAIAFVAFAPMSNVLAVNRWTADSYVYLPLVGIAVALVAAIRARIGDRHARVERLVWPALGLALAFDSLGHTSNWSTPEAVWQAVVERYPRSPIGYTEVAKTRTWLGQTEQAGAAYLELDERFPDVEWRYNERAVARLATNDPARARIILERGVAAGDVQAAMRYWSALLGDQLGPAPVDAGTAKKSFVLGFPLLRGQIADPRAWSRMAAILEKAGAVDEAAQASAQAASRGT